MLSSVVAVVSCLVSGNVALMPVPSPGADSGYKFSSYDHIRGSIPRAYVTILYPLLNFVTYYFVRMSG